jgi:TonB family protein
MRFFETEPPKTTTRSFLALLLLVATASCGGNPPPAPPAPFVPPCSTGPIDRSSLEGGPDNGGFVPDREGQGVALLNLAGVQRELLRRMGPLRDELDRDVTATDKLWRAEVWMLVDAGGEVIDARIASSTGSPRFNAAAVQVAQVYRFSPIVRDGCAVPGWLQLPITFQIR